jgi:hypothetical protein
MAAAGIPLSNAPSGRNATGSQNSRSAAAPLRSVYGGQAPDAQGDEAPSTSASRSIEGLYPAGPACDGGTSPSRRRPLAGGRNVARSTRLRPTIDGILEGVRVQPVKLHRLRTRTSVSVAAFQTYTKHLSRFLRIPSILSDSKCKGLQIK